MRGDRLQSDFIETKDVKEVVGDERGGIFEGEWWTTAENTILKVRNEAHSKHYWWSGGRDNFLERWRDGWFKWGYGAAGLNPSEYFVQKVLFKDKDKGQQLLYQAAVDGNRAAVKFLLANGVEIDTLYRQGDGNYQGTVLHYAEKNNKKDAVAFLVSKEASTSIYDSLKAAPRVDKEEVEGANSLCHPR